MVLYTGLLWPLIITHGLTDFFGFLAIGGVSEKSGATPGQMALTAAYLAAFSVYGAFLLRRRPTLDVAVSTLP